MVEPFTFEALARRASLLMVIRRMFCRHSDQFSEVVSLEGRHFAQCLECGLVFEIPPEPRS